MQKEQSEMNAEMDTDVFQPLVDEAIVLTGPTAAGKSAVAVALAQRMGADILSLDSIAVYRGMDIGTAKPSRADRELVSHHLIDLVDPSEEFNVACYLRQAHTLVRQLKDRGRGVIFVGGTPMFLKGVLRGFDPGPPADWEFRRSVEVDIERHGVDALRERLRQVDPLAAHRIGPNDTRRMIRALEVARHTGTPISHRQVQFDSQRDAESCNVFSLQWPRHQLHERINARVAQMFDRGLVDEIRGLLQQYGGLSRTASQAVGYREIIDWLGQGGALQGVQGGDLQGVQGGDLQGVQRGDLQGVIEEVAAHTRQLARRQETWFRSFTEIRAIDVSQPIEPNEVADRIHGMLVDSPSPSGQ